MKKYNLQELSGGHSGAKNYKLTTDSGANYMLKIFPEDFPKHKIDSIPHICNLYKQLDIDSLECFKTGQLNSTGQYYCVYNYIDGENMEEIGDRDYDETRNYQLGLHVGEYMKRLKTATPPPEANLEMTNVEEYTSNVIRRYQELIKTAGEIVFSYISRDDIEELLRRFKQSSSLFRDLPQTPIHGDIKRSNFMTDQTGKLYLIDIESMKYGYDMMNFRHQMTWLLRPDHSKRMAFTKGIFDSLYDYTRPQYFNEQLVYIYTLNFIEHAAKQDNHRDKLVEYLELIQRSLPMVLSPQGKII